MERATMITADGFPIIDGMRVWDYNLERATVDLASLDSDGWFYVVSADGSKNLHDWQRVCVRHPYTRESA
jgi:hypothetical protein